jgi:hypothetical protein
MDFVVHSKVACQLLGWSHADFTVESEAFLLIQIEVWSHI